MAFITGGGQGVGRRIALQLAEEGCAVAVNDYFAERAEAVAAEIRAAGGRAHAAPADITVPAAIDAAIAGAVAALGPIDIIVNNAGVPSPTASSAANRAPQRRARKSASGAA